MMGMISAVRVRSVTWVGEMQFDGRTGGGIEMRSAMPNSRPR